MSKKPEIVLGQVVQDKITGFCGVAVARTLWLNGCDRVTIQPQRCKEDGSPIESQTFDAEQIAVIGEKPVAPPHKPGGGPMQTPKQF